MDTPCHRKQRIEKSLRCWFSKVIGCIACLGVLQKCADNGTDCATTNRLHKGTRLPRSSHSAHVCHARSFLICHSSLSRNELSATVLVLTTGCFLCRKTIQNDALLEQVVQETVIVVYVSCGTVHCKLHVSQCYGNSSCRLIPQPL